MPTIRRTAGVLAILGALSLVPTNALAQCQAEDPVGYVERFSGGWVVERDGGNQPDPVRRGTCVGRDDRLRLSGTVSATASITVMLYTGKPYTSDCGRKSCTSAFTLGNVPAARTGGITAYLKALWDKKGPDTPAIFVAARGGSDQILPAVAVYDTDRLKLAGAVGQFAAGTRAFRLRRQLPTPGPELQFTMAVPQGDAVIPRTAPGVYSLEPLDEAGGATGPAAAILVLARPDPTAEALFAEALAEVRTWPDTDRALANAYLTQAILALNAGTQP